MTERNKRLPRVKYVETIPEPRTKMFRDKTTYTKFWNREFKKKSEISWDKIQEWKYKSVLINLDGSERTYTEPSYETKTKATKKFRKILKQKLDKERLEKQRIQKRIDKILLNTGYHAKVTKTKRFKK